MHFVTGDGDYIQIRVLGANGELGVTLKSGGSSVVLVWAPNPEPDRLERVKVKMGRISYTNISLKWASDIVSVGKTGKKPDPEKLKSWKNFQLWCLTSRDSNLFNMKPKIMEL